MSPRFTMTFLTLCILDALALASSQNPLSIANRAAWNKLTQSVGSRMTPGSPLASPCTGRNGSTSSECRQVQSNYRDEAFRSSIPGGFVNPQWETCQATGEQCLLDYTNTSDLTPILSPHKCELGSVPSYFIDVQSAEDVARAFEFSRKSKVPVVIKNTGHDYKGRSSAPGSLALWTHNLKDITYNPHFVPDGCAKASPGVTVGAGVQWKDAYAFAELHNITVVGGSDNTVGVSGGWLQGGGHSLLSNTMGLGVDRVLQFKVVTPDGHLRTANACKNKDLFFALRGGGGGTFGVVLESTHLASPRVALQVVIVSFSSPNTTLTKEMWSIMADNGLKWSNEGWGAISRSQIAIHITPKLNKEQAAKSLAPMIQFGQRLKTNGVPGAQLVVTEFPSWGTFFTAFSNQYVASVGVSLALTSRLINKSNFQTPSSRSNLVSGMLDADAATPGLLIMMTAPASYPGDGQTSINEAWRKSLYHVTVTSAWNWNATVTQKREHYAAASNSIDHLRKITPNAAYLNEADVYEPNHEVSFWGSHYSELLRIKRKYDPEHLLDCWQCVGWNAASPRFSCYL